MKKEKRKEKLIYVGVVILGILLYLTSGTKSERIKDNALPIDPPGGGTKYYSVDARVGEDLLEELEIRVPAREYSEEELEDLLKDCIPKAKLMLLNGNAGFDSVEDDLCFFEKIEGYPFSFEWEAEDPERIGVFGELLSQEPFETRIRMIAYHRSFSRDFGIPIRAVPGKRKQTAIKRGKLQKLVTEQLENNAMNDAEGPGSDKDPESAEKNELILPDSMEGEKIEYFTAGERRNPAYLAVTAGVCFALWYGFKKDREKRKSERIQRIREDFPGMLPQMTMYLSAGMTVRNIWFFLCEEAAGSGKPRSPLTEEMEITVNELKSGASEAGAYADFGKRTAIPETVRFSALLSQNIRTGGSRLSDLLREETEKAVTQQKQRAVKAGEEAGTKLLFPMMLLLGDMMAIIMVPAFMTIV